MTCNSSASDFPSLLIFFRRHEMNDLIDQSFAVAQEKDCKNRNQQNCAENRRRSPFYFPTAWSIFERWRSRKMRIWAACSSAQPRLLPRLLAISPEETLFRQPGIAARSWPAFLRKSGKKTVGQKQRSKR